MAHLTSVVVSQTGTTQTLAAAGGSGDNCNASDRAFLVVNNGSGGSINVILAAGVVCNQGGTHPSTVAVAAGATKFIGPLTPGRFGDPVSWTYSANTSVTVGVFIC